MDSMESIDIIVDKADITPLKKQRGKPRRSNIKIIDQPIVKEKYKRVIDNNEVRLCACGCGEELKSKLANITYLIGHKPENEDPDIDIKKLCKGKYNNPEDYMSLEYQLGGIKPETAKTSKDGAANHQGTGITKQRITKLHEIIDNECGPFAERILERFIQVALLRPDDPDFKKYGANNIMSAALEVIKYRFGRPIQHVESSMEVNVNKRICDVTKLVNNYYETKTVEPKQLNMAQQIIQAEVIEEEKGELND